MTIENRWTWANIAILVTLGGTIFGTGVSFGTLSSRMEKMEEGYRQSSIDSRTLIEVSKDVAYIKDSLSRIMSQSAVTAASSICPTDRPIWVAPYCKMCETETPILVASYCRSAPN